MTLHTHPKADPTALAEVERIFHAQITSERLHPGAALAVYHGGSLMLDLVGGLADNQQAVAVEPTTMFVLFSSTKPLASTAVLQQIERGQAELDEPVVRHWPEFGANGKGGVTIRHILTHRGGFPETPPELTPDKWGDWAAVAAAMAGANAKYEPGTVSAYHALNHGWVCGELVRRLDGRPFSTYLREEITGPLGMDDTYVGLPAALEDRVARLHAMEDVDEATRPIVRLFNQPATHQAVIPAGCGIATARDMARFYAALAAGGTLDGARILAAETVALATAIEIDDDVDRFLGSRVRRGLGFNLGGIDEPTLRFGANSTARTFGHGGAGTSICWADADLNLAVAFLPNGFRTGPDMARRCRVISDAVRAAVS